MGERIDRFEEKWNRDMTTLKTYMHNEDIWAHLLERIMHWLVGKKGKAKPDKRWVISNNIHNSWWNNQNMKEADEIIKTGEQGIYLRTSSMQCKWLAADLYKDNCQLKGSAIEKMSDLNCNKENIGEVKLRVQGLTLLRLKLLARHFSRLTELMTKIIQILQHCSTS